MCTENKDTEASSGPNTPQPRPDAQSPRSRTRRAVVHAALWWSAVAAITLSSTAIALATRGSLSSFTPTHEHFDSSRALETLRVLANSSTSTGRLCTQGGALEAIDKVARIVGEYAGSSNGTGVAVEVLKTFHDVASRIDQQLTWSDHMPLLTVRLSDGSDACKAHAVLVDAHVDTVWFSPGVSDDGVSVAMAVQTIRSIVDMGRYPYAHAVIFVFGCEEMAYQGAESFMQQHPWRTSVRAFVNLESGGAQASVQPLLQYTGQWVAEQFAGVPHPVAFPLTNDLFGHGIVPSGTHYAVYSKYGLQGADLAFFLGGWWYHTPLDNLGRVDQKAIQLSGENLLCASPPAPALH
eukprot:m51a1_g6226 hypothetical protein (351) ;mRNA; r:240087-241210